MYFLCCFIWHKLRVEGKISNQHKATFAPAPLSYTAPLATLNEAEVQYYIIVKLHLFLTCNTQCHIVVH